MAIRTHRWPLIASSVVPSGRPEHVTVRVVVYIGKTERWHASKDFLTSTHISEIQAFVAAMTTEAFARVAEEISVGA